MLSQNQAHGVILVKEDTATAEISLLRVSLRAESTHMDVIKPRNRNTDGSWHMAFETL